MKGGSKNIVYKMEKAIKITLIVVGTVVFLALLWTFILLNLFPGASGEVISTQGNSKIQVSPDLVTIYFNIETNGSSTKIANDANSVIFDNLLSEVLKLGFKREEVQTQSLNIYEDIRWENDRQKSYGFKASHQIKIQMSSNQASLIGEVVDAGVNAGALLQWINFELSTGKQNEYKALALKQAGEDARIKAQAIAEGLGVRIGSKPISISTSDWEYRPWNLYMSKAGGMVEDAAEAKLATANIVPGDQEVTGYVSVAYKIR